MAEHCGHLANTERTCPLGEWDEKINRNVRYFYRDWYEPKGGHYEPPARPALDQDYVRNRGDAAWRVLLEESSQPGAVVRLTRGSVGEAQPRRSLTLANVSVKATCDTSNNHAPDRPGIRGVRWPIEEALDTLDVRTWAT